MAVNSSEKGQDAYSIVVLPDEGTTVRQCGSHLSFLSFLEIPKGLKHSLSLDTVLNSQEMENADVYCPCIADVDIEKGKSDTPKINDAPVGKNEDTMARTLHRHINVQMGGNFLQLLMDHSLVLPKFNFRDKSGPEKVHDMPNSRPRKYKRSASFNSRKVVLLFSVLSSVGTLILIYLTLRVRQMANGSVHA